MGAAGTLAELVADVATTDPDQPAIIFGDQSISYAQLNAVIERAADGLAACGVRPGDRVALMVPNRPDFVIAYYAILRLGAIAVPVNVLYKAEEIAHVLGRHHRRGADHAPAGCHNPHTGPPLGAPFQHGSGGLAP